MTPAVEAAPKWEEFTEGVTTWFRHIGAVAFVVAGASFAILAIDALATWDLPYVITQILAGGFVFGLYAGSIASKATLMS